MIAKLGKLIVGSIRIPPIPAPPWTGDLSAFPQLSSGTNSSPSAGSPPVSEEASRVAGSVGCVTPVVIPDAHPRDPAFSDLEVVEDFFGQLWIIPDSSHHPPPRSSGSGVSSWRRIPSISPTVSLPQSLSASLLLLDRLLLVSVSGDPRSLRSSAAGLWRVLLVGEGDVEAPFRRLLLLGRVRLLEFRPRLLKMLKVIRFQALKLLWLKPRFVRIKISARAIRGSGRAMAIRTTIWLNFRNCGVVVVKKGVTNLSGLEKNLTVVFCKNKKWPWQIRELDPHSYLARFPPWKKVEDLIEFPAFDLEADAVTVKIIAWDMEVAAMSELSELWVTVKGIPPKWCAWKTFAQVASVLGILMDIYWPTLFKSLYVSVWMKVAVRDVSKMGSDAAVIQSTSSTAAATPLPVNSCTGNKTCELAPLVIDVGEVQFTDHMSWNGEDRADSNMGDDLVSVDSLCSLPDRWNYSRVDDYVWDFDPGSLGFEDCVEREAVNILEQSTSHLAYCSGILQSLDDDGSVEEYGSAQEEEGECLSPTVCDQLSTVKKDLLPFLDQATGQNLSLTPEKPKKSKWGPVIAPRMSTRNHGNQNIIDKAKEYQKRKNLEVPSRLKGNSFVVLDNCILGNMASSVRIDIGVDEVDRDSIIDNIVSAEIDRNRVFVNHNPELVLPHVDIFHDQSLGLLTDFPPLPCACDHRLPDGSQPCNVGVWKTIVSKSSSRKKHNKRHDRCNMEH
ncbi:hypothetical protein ACQ4PT_007779 [Festuca glaucescens]